MMTRAIDVLKSCHAKDSVRRYELIALKPALYEEWLVSLGILPSWQMSTVSTMGL